MALGPEHPDVAQSIDNQPLLYYARGSYTEAEALLQMALAIYEKDLGAGHTVEISMTLCHCLHGAEDDHGG